ncbi:MAG: hypothetical protein A2136_05430 [Chloroflexi bacterium RBG_16_54_11]|nr:MAG: hypothetical protein A2136_05430 [Chloroflexi bacterium RBG_16_54_11]
MNKIGLILFIGLMLLGSVLPTSGRQDFISDWIQLAPEINTTVPFKLPSRPVEVHLWTPVYLESKSIPDRNEWVQPAENLGYVNIVYISDREIVIANNSALPVWVQVYAR